MANLPMQASQMISNHLTELSQIAVSKQYEHQSEFWKHYDPEGYSKSIRDAGYHFSYLAEALAVNDNTLFIDYVAWAKVLFTGLKFPANILPTTLHFMKQAIENTIQPDFAAIANSFINIAMDHLASVSEFPESFIRPDNPFFELADHYLQTILNGDRQGASKLILDSVAHGTGIMDVYLNVFQPVQLEIGRLWQTNQVSVAQEHFCTVVTQMVMSQLYPQIFAGEKISQCAIATSVSGDLHEIGIRMVADFLEISGWDTYYLGANTPTNSIIRTIKEKQAGLIAISATIPFNVSKVTDLIAQIRANSFTFPIKILVGGYPFNISPNLWRQVGADAYARDAKEAVFIAQKLIQETK